MDLLSKCVTLAVVLNAACIARAADPAELAKRLHHVADVTSLDDPALKPWHLKLAVQLYDAKGDSSEQGTIEEWWTPDADRRVYDTPSYKATEIRTSKGQYRTIGMPTVPYMLNAVRERVVHPMPTSDEIDGAKPSLKVENFGIVKLDCIMLEQEIQHLKHPPVGLFPTYCLDPRRDLLRVSYKFGSELSALNRMGDFEGRSVAVDAEISFNNVKAVSSHIAGLEERAIDASLFVPGSDMEDQRAALTKVGAGVIAGRIITKVTPTYPEIDKQQHLSGDVILHAIIGTDGRIHELSVVSAPDASLAISAMAAVRRWIYKPYLLSGIAVEVDTQIAVHYRFGAS